MNTTRQLKWSAFTLIEIMIAVAAFAIVLAAINTIFYTALRLRNSTTAAIEKALPMEHALGVIRRDHERAWRVQSHRSSLGRDRAFLLSSRRSPASHRGESVPYDVRQRGRPRSEP